MSDSSPTDNPVNPGEDSLQTEQNNTSSNYSEPKEVPKPEEDQLNVEVHDNMDLDDPSRDEKVPFSDELVVKNENDENLERELMDEDKEDDLFDTVDKEDKETEDEPEKEKEEHKVNDDEDNLDQTKENKENEDDDLHGLFEDSDDQETQDSKPVPVKQPVEEEKEKPMVVEDVTEVINTTLNDIPRPGNEDNLVICKFPPTLLVSSHPDDLKAFLKSNSKILENPPNLNNLPILCWKSMGYNSNTSSNNTSGSNNVNTSNNSSTSDTNKDTNSNFNNDVMSNGKLVLWDDGTLTLFVGRIPLDCEFRPEVSFLLEDSRPELKPVHAQVNTRLQTRFSNLLKNDLIKKNVKVKRQKMEVTSLSDAIQSQYTLQQNLMNVRESERSRRSHYSSKGLTKTFLESSDIEDDDDLL